MLNRLGLEVVPADIDVTLNSTWHVFLLRHREREFLDTIETPTPPSYTREELLYKYLNRMETDGDFILDDNRMRTFALLGF